MSKWIEKQPSILNEYEVRIYGLIHIIEGVYMIIFGNYAGKNLVFNWILKKSKQKENL